MIKRRYIKFTGKCVVSKNIIENNGRLKWCFREYPVNEEDNGWRFLSDIDTEDFINDSKNMGIYSFNDLVEFEPAILNIFNLPIGTDLTITKQGKKTIIIDNNTGKYI